MNRLEGADRESLAVGYRATSELLRITCPEDAAGVLIQAVTELGGTTVPPRLAGDDALPLDLSCGHGEPLLPVARRGTVTRARLKSILPALIEDALIAVVRTARLGRLGEQVEIDPLTGLLNRRAVERLLPRLAPGEATVVIDLDGFKELNDRHGHAAGDAVLTAFSRLLREQGRAGDRYSRLGGEEFLGIYPATNVDEVARGLDRLRSAWSRVAPLPATFSAGIAAVGADGGSAAVDDADAAMDAAKRAGRNRTVVHEFALAPGVAAHTPQPRTPADDILARARGAEKRLLQHMAASDVGNATELVEQLLDDGATSKDILGLLTSAQEKVGRQWQSGAWSIADEHAATAVADTVLATLSTQTVRRDAGADGLRVAVTCPEGEWHQLPARMFAAHLVDSGISVKMLGPSLPAGDLQRALSHDRPIALALSCTLAKNLPSVEASIRAAHECGVPVLVGGRAFGEDSRRADRLGADAWSIDVTTAVAVVHRWQQHPPAIRLPEQRDHRPRLIMHDGVEPAILDLAADNSPTGDELTSAQQREIRGYARLIVDYVNAAVILDDDRIFVEFTEWLADVAASRHLAQDFVSTAYRGIDELAADDNASARRQLRLGLTTCQTLWSL